MFPARLLRPWLGSPAAPPAGPRRGSRLRVERLEDRDQPSGGSLDPTFGSGGLATADLGSTADVGQDAVLQADGKVVAVGRTTTSAGSVFAVARFLPGGGLDPAFGTGGVAKT